MNVALNNQGPSAGLNMGLGCTTAYAYGLFQQPWWLDAAAPGGWDEVRVHEDGDVVARLPFARKRRYGLIALTQPPLTQHLGPWLRPSEGKPATRLGREIALLQGLITQLPRHDLFRMRFAPQIENYLPFYWAGFEASPRYTYRLEDVSDLGTLWNGFDAKVRNQIRKADKIVTVRTDVELDRVLDLQDLTFRRQGLSSVTDRGLYYRLDEACVARGCRLALIAEDSSSRMHAAGYYVWDEASMYYLYGGLNPELRASSAMSLVIWEAIKQAHRVGVAFDFEGSMVPGIERFFRSFGARQVQSLLVWRMSRRLRIGRALHDLAIATFGFRTRAPFGTGHA